MSIWCYAMFGWCASCLLTSSLQWRHDKRDVVSNHRRLHCLLNHLLRRRSKKTSKLRVTGLFEGNPSVTGGFPSQRASNAEMFPFDDVIMIQCLLVDRLLAYHKRWFYTVMIEKYVRTKGVWGMRVIWMKLEPGTESVGFIFLLLF